MLLLKFHKMERTFLMHSVFLSKLNGFTAALFTGVKSGTNPNVHHLRN